ncbi:PEP-CTERM sorting domain-containing protein [Coraliomargarita sp. W4R53]
MPKNKLILCTVGLCLSHAVFAQTTFLGGNLYDDSNWSNSQPEIGGDGTINVDGSANAGQKNLWTSGATTTVGGGATLTLGTDIAVTGGTLIVNDATIHADDDIFADSGTLILNADSAVTAGDDFEANANEGSVKGIIIINGGVHASGSAVGNNVGAQGGASKIGTQFNMLGGQITAGTYRFQLNSVNSVGGTGTLLSASSGTLLTMDGSMNVINNWSGSWTVGGFAGNDWRDLVLAGDWTLSGVEIDATLFDSSFAVTDAGKTLSLTSPIPEPSTYALVGGLLALGVVTLCRRNKS